MRQNQTYKHTDGCESRWWAPDALFEFETSSSNCVLTLASVVHYDQASLRTYVAKTATNCGASYACVEFVVRRRGVVYNWQLDRNNQCVHTLWVEISTVAFVPARPKRRPLHNSIVDHIFYLVICWVISIRIGRLCNWHLNSKRCDSGGSDLWRMTFLGNQWMIITRRDISIIFVQQCPWAIK